MACRAIKNIGTLFVHIISLKRFFLIAVKDTRYWKQTAGMNFIRLDCHPVLVPGNEIVAVNMLASGESLKSLHHEHVIARPALQFEILHPATILHGNGHINFSF
jgi:hypothetical protein